MSKLDYEKVYRLMRERFGHRNWWPGDTSIEIIVGAILTQNTNWKNVEKALDNLKEAKRLSYSGLRDIDRQELAELIRPSGYYNQKAIKLKAFIEFLRDRYGGCIKRMFRAPTETLRKQLLAVKGIGPETADSILLYAGGHLSFVIDLYTKRIMIRHGWAKPDVTYDELKAMFEKNVKSLLDRYQDYHAQLVAVGHKFCRKTPSCEDCPLQSLLPKKGLHDF